MKIFLLLAAVPAAACVASMGEVKPQAVALSGFEWHKIRSRVLFVHHADDGCRATPCREAQRAAREPHGFLGKEAETVDAIAAWMLGKPFPKEIR